MADSDPKPPRGLSAWSRAVWTDLFRLRTFVRHELVTFEHALAWWDRQISTWRPLMLRLVPIRPGSANRP